MRAAGRVVGLGSVPVAIGRLSGIDERFTDQVFGADHRSLKSVSADPIIPITDHGVD